jgi:hypothetical protein
MAEQDKPRRRRVEPPGGFGPEFVVVWLVFFLLAAVILLGLFLVTKPAEAKAPALVITPGTIAVVIVNPPQPVSCDLPGWTFRYTPNGIDYRAQSAQYNSAAMVLDLVPALDQCAFADGFEQ